jgi:hypothetical protein
MKTKVAVTFAALAVLFLSACAGVKAREEVLMPRMAEAFARIEPEVERGMVARSLPAPEVEGVRDLVRRVREALGSGNRAELMPLDWPRLRDLAQAGIMDRVGAGEIDVGVAAGKIERLRLFTESWAKVLER